MGGDWRVEEWARESGMFSHAARVILEDMVSNGRLVLDEDFFLRVYPEISRMAEKYRGWLNPLVSPYTVFHFYSQAVMVVSPARDEVEFTRLHGIRPRILERLVGEGRVLLLLTDPHINYTCECYERLLGAQGSLPTILRVTETIKAILTKTLGEGLWDTKTTAQLLGGILGDEEGRDLATRLGDLASLGYKKLATQLYDSITSHPSPMLVSLARVLHHLLVEPVIDSGATIAILSSDEISFVREVASKAPPGWGPVLEALAWSLPARAKLRVPRRIDGDKLVRLATDEAMLRVHRLVYQYRRELSRLPSRPESISEAAEIARDAAMIAEKANESRLAGDKRAALLGLIAQVPVSILMSPLDSWNLLVSAVTGTLAGAVAAELAKEAISKLFEKMEHVFLLPVTPTIYEAIV